MFFNSYTRYRKNDLPERFHDRIKIRFWIGSFLPFRLYARSDMRRRWTPCWIWTGKWNSGNGYGKVRYEGRIWMAHRLVYSLLASSITPNLVLDHRCRRRRCCNPNHLDPVTIKVNTHRGEAVLFKQETAL